MNKFYKLAASMCTILAAGCASHGQVAEVENTSETNQKILRENEARLHNLESSISALNTQVAQLNNRVYEVRTRSGQKTSMTVVPVGQEPVAPKSAPVAAKPAAPAKNAPTARKIDPRTKPAPLPATAPVQAAKKPAQPKAAPASAAAGASGRIGQSEASSAQTAALPPDGALEMPPTDVPASVPPVPGGNTTYSGSTISAHAQNQITANNETVVPVPLINSNELSLPPEHPGLPAEVAAQQTTAPQSQVTETPQQKQPAPRTTRASAPQKGEEAAYQAALRAARSGNTTEGIRLFRDFLQKYPNGRYAANADYWIGECLYAQGKYQDALSQFQTVNDSFPKHHKNADALLKAGMSLSRMGDKTAAQEKFRQILSSFPNSDAAKRVRAMGIR